MIPIDLGSRTPSLPHRLEIWRAMALMPALDVPWSGTLASAFGAVD
ncbi:hypothetical protein [Rhodococcus sovatensis]|uniref:Uncharacterized protein n=1 Tax=Rhodococcus sovatensis TaxID=1805840 RepID=A0ABZ2PLW1_9NOCA